MKTLLITIFSCLTIGTAYGQIEMFQIEKASTKFELIIPDEFIIPEFPTGVILQNTDGNGFVNMSTDHLRVASKPIGFQFQIDNVVWTEMTDNSFTINKYDSPFDQTFWIGPAQMGFWGPRNPAAPMGSEYDLNTYGNIWNKDSSNRKLTELTQSGGRGALKLYRYSGGFIYYNQLSVDASGNIAWTALSDRRLKENIQPMKPILEKVVKLEMKTYNYIGSDVSSKGYIAQEVQEIFPELVEELDEGYLGVNYAGFSTLAIQAVKEQQEIIDNLEARLAKLEELLDK